MIYDTLNNLPNYLGVSDNLDTVIEYIMARDITTLPAGRTRIDGEKAVVTVSTVTPQSSDKALFQRHDAHIVLETDLEGSELFEVSLAELTPTKPTDEAADTTVGTAGTSIAGMLCEGRFALYLAGEPYKSGLKAQGCGYTVVPHELEREGMNINKLWLRRQTTKFNGVPYVVQRAAAAVFTESGMAEIQSNLDYYRRNAKVIADALDECGVWYCGGKNSPYIWLRCPGNMKSWEFFDWLLENCGVVGTPGVGFGECGEGYFRLTAFGDAEKTKLAAQRIKAAIKAL